MGMRALDIHVFSHKAPPAPLRPLSSKPAALLFFYFSLRAYTLVRGFHGPDGLERAEEPWRARLPTIAR